MRALRMGVCGAIAGIVLALGVVAQASAHDQLIQSNPAEGDALTSAPETVTLTFTADVMTLGAAIVVADGTGTDWVAGDPAIEGDTLTVPLRADMPEAGYEIRWRVVSSDGHPIAGLVPFTVGDAAPLVRESTQPPEDASAPHENAQSTPAGDVMRVVIIGAAGAALAAAGYALIHRIRRRTSDGVSASTDEVDDAEEDIERQEIL